MSKTLRGQALGLLLLFGTAFFCYLPALDLPFRDPDQINYFAELKGDYSLSNGLRFLDYGLTRTYWKGDEFLYRPLLFFWLAIQSHFFSYHHFYWNSANLLLHMFILILLYRLLYVITPGIFAFLFCLLFAVSSAPIGLVLNPHLGGYLWAYLLLLGAYFQLIHLSRTNNQSFKNNLLFSIFVTLGCFFHEYLLFFSLTVLCFHCFKKSSGLKPIFAIAPLLIYLIFYRFRNLQSSDHLFFVFQQGHTLLPDASKLIQLGLDIRRNISDFVLDVLPDQRWLKLGLLAVFCLCFISPKTLTNRAFLTKQRIFPFLLLGLYILLTAYFRGTFFRDYYQYFFFLLSAISAYSLLDFSEFSKKRVALCSVFLLILIGINLWGTYSYLKYRSMDYKDVALYHRALTKYVDQNRWENSFSFTIEDPSPDIDWPVHLALGYPDHPTKESFVPLSHILCAPYLQSNAKIRLKWDLEKRVLHEENALR